MPARDPNRQSGPVNVNPLLLTPGPLTTAPETRAAMQRDWGSRNRDFIALTARLRTRLAGLVGHGDGLTTVPLQGSGTFAVEAMLASLVRPDDGVLVLENGAYGRRMAEICRRLGRRHRIVSWPEHEAPPDGLLERAIAGAPDCAFVALVHVETTTGILNPVDAAAQIAARHGRRLLLDSMSAFGAMPVDAAQTPFTALAASANKCLEGVPGAAFVIARPEALAAAAGNAPSLSLDLHDQWRGFEATGEWRFTPPTQVLAALDAALDGLESEGGPEGRRRRYARNAAVLRAGMAALGFTPLLDEAVQAPIILTFLEPAVAGWQFQRFYDGLLARGYAIYPGKLAARPSFRIGCIGQIFEADMAGVVEAARETLAEMGITLR